MIRYEVLYKWDWASSWARGSKHTCKLAAHLQYENFLRTYSSNILAGELEFKMVSLDTPEEETW